MRKPILIFLAIAFIIYWLYAIDLPGDSNFSFGTIKPIITRIMDADPQPTTPVQRAPTQVLKPPSSEKKMSLQHWLMREAVRVGEIDLDPSQTIIRLKEKAAHLGSKDLKLLKRLALQNSLSSDARFLAVYLLGLAESGGAVALLKELCFAQIPKVPTDRQHSEEVILRAQAVEALVQRITAREARTMLRELLSRTSDPILARQAQYWLNKLS